MRYFIEHYALKRDIQGFSYGAVDKNPPARAGDIGSVPSLSRFYLSRSN